jgi:hypothetical protein
MLEIEKVAKDLFVARASPPEVDEAWSTPEPLSARRLLKELIDIRGGHSSDISAALFAQDPEWADNVQGPNE